MTPALRSTLRRRVLRRAKRNWPELVTLFLVTVIGFTLSNSFFVASTSVLGDLERFSEENNQESGYFIAGEEVERARGEIAEGVESVLSADVPGPDDSTLRVFPPREAINLHEVVTGHDLGSEDDVLLDEQYANAHELEVGDRVSLGSRDFDLVGFATAPDYMTTKTNELVLQPNADEFGIAFVTGDTFDAEFLDGAAQQFAFDERTDVPSLIDEYSPALIRDSANNSRIQQVIGDSAAPRDLAAIIFVIFTAILVALVSVYHFETRRSEQRDIATFERLGLVSRLRGHYRVETIITLLAAWAVSTALTTVAATPIMSINGRLYNYPPLSVDVLALVAVSLVTLVVLLAVDSICYLTVHRRPRGSKPRKGRGTPRVSTSGLRFIPDFGLRLRLVKALRNPRDPLSLVALVLIVSLFVNFSFMLKISVDEYVAMLDQDTEYEYMYVLSEPLAEAGLERESDESARLTTLYDDDHVAQMVFSVPSDSRFFGEVEDPTVTAAFADKYGVGAGEELRLTDIEAGSDYELEIGAVNGNSTSALVYVPEEHQIEDSSGTAPSVPVLFSETPHPDLHDVVPTVSREGIVSSGESIVEIIAIQVSLLIGIAMALLAIMLFSIYRFTYATQGEFVRIMRMNGYPPGVLNRALFGYTVPLVVLLVALTSFAASAMVRAFFDRIMATFVTFVPASTSYVPFTLTCSTVLVLFVVVLIRSRFRLKRS